MEGCRKRYDENECDTNEDRRLTAALNQPTSVQNYTTQGYKMVRAPPSVIDHLVEYWNSNKYNMKEERWPYGTTTVNHWISPTYVVNVNVKMNSKTTDPSDNDTSNNDDDITDTNNRLRGRKSNNNINNHRRNLTFRKEQIVASTKQSMEEWTGKDMKPSAMYGIRVYTHGSIVPPHVDRIPQLSSTAIINVAQDLDTDWVFEMYNRQNGQAENVTLNVGDMMLYESGSLIHGVSITTYKNLRNICRSFFLKKKSAAQNVYPDQSLTSVFDVCLSSRNTISHHRVIFSRIHSR